MTRKLKVNREILIHTTVSSNMSKTDNNFDISRDKMVED
jgi:hypothetical protein